jgi:release factor glutamine methyltransferase
MLIQDIVKILTDSGIEPNEANVEVRLLIEAFAGYSVADIIMGKRLTEEKLQAVAERARLRAKTGKPIQYIIGQADFMGEKFIVNESVLIPRDETELLVRKAVEIIEENGYREIMDMCTGSGCIACMIAKLTQAAVMGVDISTEAIHVALDNMAKMSLFNRATFRKSNLFEKIREDEKFDMIVSNPPYIAPKYKKDIQKEVRFEPEIALFTKDQDGLEFYKQISSDAVKHLRAGGYLVFELGIGQSGDVAEIMSSNGYKDIKILKDLAGIDRVIWGNL